MLLFYDAVAGLGPNRLGAMDHIEPVSQEPSALLGSDRVYRGLQERNCCRWDQNDT